MRCREVLQEARAAAAAAEPPAAPGSNGSGSDGGSGADAGDDNATPAAGALGILDYGVGSPSKHAQRVGRPGNANAPSDTDAATAGPDAASAAALNDAGLHGGNESASVHMHDCQPGSGTLAHALLPMRERSRWHQAAVSATQDCCPRHRPCRGVAGRVTLATCGCRGRNRLLAPLCCMCEIFVWVSGQAQKHGKLLFWPHFGSATRAMEVECPGLFHLPARLSGPVPHMYRETGRHRH